jgi:hypothetical protein
MTTQTTTDLAHFFALREPLEVQSITRDDGSTDIVIRIDGGYTDFFDADAIGELVKYHADEFELALANATANASRRPGAQRVRARSSSSSSVTVQKQSRS